MIEETAEPAAPVVVTPTMTTPQTGIESEEVWRARIEREQEEQFLRELQRQRMASLQADGAAFDSPIAVNLQGLDVTASDSNANEDSPASISIALSNVADGTNTNVVGGKVSVHAPGALDLADQLFASKPLPRCGTFF